MSKPNTAKICPHCDGMDTLTPVSTPVHSLGVEEGLVAVLHFCSVCEKHSAEIYRTTATFVKKTAMFDGTEFPVRRNFSRETA